MKEVHIIFKFEGATNNLIELNPIEWMFGSIPRKGEFVVLKNFVDVGYYVLSDDDIKKLNEFNWEVYRITWTGPGEVIMNLRIKW